MSKRTFWSGESGASRPVVVGGLGAVALVAAAILGWLVMSPDPEETVDVAPSQDVQPAPAAETPPASDATPQTQADTQADTQAVTQGDAHSEKPVEEPAQADVAPAPDTGPETAPQAEVAQSDVPAEDDTAATAAAPAPSVSPEEAAPEADAPPVFEVVRVEDTGDAVIAGRAPAGGVVRILLDGESVAETAADASGAFVALLSLDPSGDPRVLTLESIGRSGEAVVSEETALVAPFVAPVPEPAPETDMAALAPPAEPVPPSDVAEAPAEAPAGSPASTDVAVGSQVLQPEAPKPAPAQTARLETPPQVVIVAPDGAVPQSPAAAPARPDAPDSPNVVIDTISYDEEGEVILVGRAQSGSFVRLYLDNILTETVTVDDNGAWRSRVTGIDAGVYTLRADETEDGGRVMSRFETPFERVTRPRAIAAAEQQAAAAEESADTTMRASAGIVTVQPGFTLWAIARENYGDGVQYVRVFEANRAQIRDPDLIYPGQVFSVPEQ